MFVKVANGKGSATYRCSHIEITEYKPEHQLVKAGREVPGFLVQMVGISSLELERPGTNGSTVLESVPCREEGRSLRLPDDGDVIYVMDDRLNTTKVLRPKKEARAS